MTVPATRLERPFDIVAFDIDGTLINGPDGFTVWEVLNRRFTGVPEVNRERYAAYKAGKLSYAEWVELDVTGWRDAGARRDQIVEAFAALTLVDGVRETLEELKRRGVRIIVISGTLDLMLKTVFPHHALFDEIFANHIGFDDDGRISHWKATPFDMAGKAQVLRAVAAREGVSLSRCAYVGDSSNDVWVAREAGYTVAFNSKCDTLTEMADATVTGGDLRAILPFLIGEQR